MILSINLFLLLIVILGLFYCVLIVAYTYGWFSMKAFVMNEKQTHNTRVSIIIPARNEENNIRQLLDDLLAQTYAHNYFEVLIVDDHSDDHTAEIANAFFQQNKNHLQGKLILQNGDEQTTSYKKKAIEHAIQLSTGSLIITTDADCRLNPGWLETIIDFYEKEKPKMIVGPVGFHNEGSFFEKMQSLEFLSLIAITAGSIKIGKPLMCNGANLAYEKQAFRDAGGFGNDNFSSGDDVFLLFRIKKIFGNRAIRFVKNREAVVYTEAKKTLGGFIHQRTRWASKNKGYDFKIILVSATVYFVNLFICVGLIVSLFLPWLHLAMMIALFVKIIIDLPIMVGIVNFVKRTRIFVYAVPLIFLYPFYIVLTGALGILGNYNWKGRSVSN